ncbi:MAG: tetratricopeptide repeat protein [Polyangiaceae bacterium]|nr:tetratricopeptide repeat protein [Polyangiaceae bacterium]
MKGPPPTDDLSVLARRGEATASEQRRLMMLLGASDTERFLDAFGRDCDGIALADRGDRARLERMVERVVAAAPPPRPRWARRTAATAAGVALVSVTAVAGAFTIPRWLASPTETPAATRCPGDDPATSRPPAARETAPAAPTSAGASTPSATSPSPPTPSAIPSVSPSRTDTRSAAEAFARANALRRQGRIPAALSAYSELQLGFPGSPEASLSHVVLGRLLLQQGLASAAHTQFSQYLSRTPGGALAEEAMFGQANALRMSGRTGDERRVLRQLVARFPNSITARAARTRLEELD